MAIQPWFRRPRHIALLDEILVQAAEEGNARIIVEMPPRHGKSELCSHYFPLWYLKKHPDRRIILTSYEADFAATWGRKVRNDIEEYGGEGAKLAGDSSAASRWDLTAGGGMVTAGVGGPITGRGANVLIIDDPIKNAEEAESPTIREKHWDWFKSTAFTRLEPGASVVIIMTRWNMDDMVGRLRKEMGAGGEEWRVISLPAIAEEEDEIGRQLGEALWPERYDLVALARIKATQLLHWWAALYQQRPTLREGGLWKWAWIHRVAAIPDLQRVVVAVDPSGSTAKTSDETGIVAAGKGIDGRYYVVFGGGYRLSPAGWAGKAWQLFDSWRADKIIAEKNFGGDMVEANLRSIPGHAQGPIKLINASRGKQLRADPIASLYEQGLVSHLGEQDDLEEQMCTFPHAVHDDLVDALVYALTELSVGGYEDDAGGFGPGATARISGF